MKQVKKEFNMTKQAIVGGLIGGLIGYFIGRIIVDEIWPEYFTEDELVAYQETAAKYQKVSEDILKNQHTIKGSLVPGSDEVKGHMKVRYDEQWKAENPGKARLAELANRVNHGEGVDEEDIEEEEVDTEDFEDAPANPRHMEYSDYIELVKGEETPHLISEEDYKVNAENRQKVILNYFDEDDTLVNEEMRPLPGNIDRLIGEDALFMFGVFAEDEDVVHVLNPIRNVLYRIVQLHDSYKNWIAENTAKENIFKKYNNIPPGSEEEDDDVS